MLTILGSIICLVGFFGGFLGAALFYPDRYEVKAWLPDYVSEKDTRSVEFCRRVALIRSGICFVVMVLSFIGLIAIGVHQETEQARETCNKVSELNGSKTQVIDGKCYASTDNGLVVIED